MENNFTFLICSERSGSNFITKIMDGHSQVCGPSPAHILRIFVPLERKYGDLQQDDIWKIFVKDVLTFYQLKISAWESDFTTEQLLEVQPRTTAALFRRIYEAEAKASGKTRLFVKENQAYRLIPYYQQHFPGAKFVWMIRDPRDMALSWKKDGVLRGGIVRSATTWKEDQKMSLYMHSYLGASGNMLRVHYEDLTADTASQVKRITEYLGIPFEEGMCSMLQSLSSAKNAAASVNWANLAKGVLKNNSRKFLEGLSRDETAFIEYLCREEMEALGYEPAFPAIDKKEFLDLQHRLSLEEKFEKEEYKLVGEEEKEKRKNWAQWVKELQGRF